MKIIRIISLIFLVITSLVSLDLLINFLGNINPEMNDGLVAHSIFLPTHLYFGDRLWSIERFFNAFVISSIISFAIFIENIVLTLISIKKKK